MSLEVKKSYAGLGLFALRPFKKGERIIEYFGPLFHSNEEISNKYLFEVSKDVYIDGSSRHNTARYINHSCAPNCEVRGRSRLWIYAIKNIKPGDELSYDYGEEYIKDFIKDCKCPKCTKKK
jgi:SET domain-containing protein